jgi:WD40 repeat protein
MSKQDNNWACSADTQEGVGLVFSPDGRFLFSGGHREDPPIPIWDVQTRSQVGVLGGHSAHMLRIAFSLNGKILVSTVNWDDTVHFWDLGKQEEIGVFEGHDAIDSGSLGGVAFSSDGKWLACGSENGVELWGLDQPQEMLTELMLLVMSEFYLANTDAELAWNSLVRVQEARVALDSENLDEAQAAMNDLRILINQEDAPPGGQITAARV